MVNLDGTIQFWVGHGADWAVIRGPSTTQRVPYIATCIYDGTDMTLIVNGRTVGTSAVTISKNTTGELRVGAGNSIASINHYFNGLIHELRFYNYPLSIQTAQALQNATLRGSRERLAYLGRDF